MSKNVLDEFWKVYDEYMSTGDPLLRPQLSAFLRQVEKQSRREQLFRPEKKWNEILAWQVLRGEEFIFPHGNIPQFIYEGEIIIWQPNWDRDVFTTRYPRDSKISSTGYLNPGRSYTLMDINDLKGNARDEAVRNAGVFANEKGLYLPIYEVDSVKMLVRKQFEHQKKETEDFLRKWFTEGK